MMFLLAPSSSPRRRVPVRSRGRAVRLAVVLAAWLGPRAAFAEEPTRAASSDDSNRAESEALARRLKDRVARPGGLTATEAAQRAVATSTEDRARSADIESASAEIDRAKVSYFPKLTVTGRYTRLSPITAPTIALPVPGPSISFPVILDQYLLQANAVVPISDYVLRIRQSHAAAEETAEAARQMRDASRRSVGAQAELAYYVWARAKMQESVTEQSVEQSKRHLDFARAANETGRLPQADVLRAESLLSSAELLNERTHNAARLAELRLKTLLHDRSPVPYEIGEDLLGPMDTASPGDPEALYSEALRQRPEMRAFERNRAAVDEQERAANAGNLPRLDAFGNAYLANPNSRYFPQTEEWRATWDVGVQVTWSPNDMGGAGAARRSLDAKKKRLDAERAALSDAVRDEISSAIIAYEEAHVALETAERGLGAAEEAHRVRRELFELGRGTSVELIDAESDVLRARLEMIQARVDARIARVRLEHAVGRDHYAVEVSASRK